VSSLESYSKAALGGRVKRKGLISSGV